MYLLSENQLAPQNVVELVRCKCDVTKCKPKKHCVCKRIGVTCIWLCNCETMKTVVIHLLYVKKVLKNRKS